MAAFCRSDRAARAPIPDPPATHAAAPEPTVTDANVLLGRLNPDALLSGRMPIRADLARAAIESKIARPLGLSVEEAAEGILTILTRPWFARSA